MGASRESFDLFKLSGLKAFIHCIKRLPWECVWSDTFRRRFYIPICNFIGHKNVVQIGKTEWHCFACQKDLPKKISKATIKNVDLIRKSLVTGNTSDPPSPPKRKRSI